jgi:hypothetical protein
VSGTSLVVDDLKEFGSGAEGLSARWSAEFLAQSRAFTPWRNSCRAIERRYREKDEVSNDYPVSTGWARFNVLWSNIQILLPALYSRPPIPVVTRRFRDRDPVARAASTIAQRALSYTIDDCDMDSRIRSAVLDYALYARGVAWIVFVPTFDGDGNPAGERIEWDYIHRDDFAHGPGKTWPDVDWVSRTVRMTRKDGKALFGKKFDDVPLTWRPDREADRTDDQDDVIAKAEVAEVWCRSERMVHFIGDPYGEAIPLGKEPPPLDLKNFFPCPMPLYGTMTGGTMVPVPDYVEYMDQAKELDDLTGRIQALTSAIRMNFAYDNRFPELARIFSEDMENNGIGIEQWAEFAAKNGMAGAMSFVPVQEMVVTLQALIESRTQAKADLYEITGISDIIRGAGSPEETATAQRIKGRYATLRLSERQFTVARFIRDMLRITAEVIAEKYSPATLWQMSNFGAMDHGTAAEQQPNAVELLFMQAIQMLQNERTRGFQVDIEDQSTIALDDGEDKQARMEFLTAVGAFMGQAVQLPPNLAPALLPMMGKMVLFGARGFRIGAEMETTIEDALANVAKLIEQQQQNPQPDPATIKAQAEAQKAQIEGQARMAESQSQLQIEQLRAQAIQMKAQSDQAIAGVTLQIKQMEAQAAQTRTMAEARQAEAQNAQDMTDHALKIDEAQMAREQQAHDAAIDWENVDIDWAKVGVAKEAAKAKEGGKDEV